MNQSSNNRLKNHVMFSGLAKGADSLFMNLAAKYGVGRQIHIRPVGNLGNTKNLPKGVEVLVAQSEHLFKAVDKIKELLGIELRLGMGSNLLARNYYQVSKSESVLAVAYLTGDFKSVSGGTRMAVDLGVALGLPVYVLDVSSEAWYSYNYKDNQFQLYNGIPPLTRKFTGVGTRDIENYNIKDKLTGQWVSREQFVGHDKANRLVALMEQVFIKATEIVELKVYRLEDSETGKGPFSSHVSVPFDWSESHRAPMESDSPTYEEYAKWIEKVEPEDWGLPSRYRFAFSTLERLKDCFEGYEKYPNFKIMEYIIDTSDPLSFVSLSDGQVIFCEVISKREL